MNFKLQSLQQIAHKHKLLNQSLFSINRAPTIRKKVLILLSVVLLDQPRKVRFVTGICRAVLLMYLNGERG